MSHSLKLCPFDGGAARLTDQEDEEVGGHFVFCTTCSGTAWGETIEEAVAAWSTRLTTTGPDVGRLREALDKRTSMSTISAPNARVHVEIRFACLSEAHGLVDAILNRPALEPRTAGEAKGAPISDWSWWVGSDETVSEDGLYDLYEAGTRDDAIGWAECHVDEGEIFHIIEARTRALQADDEFMPFVDRRNAMTFKVNSEGVAVEVAAHG